MPVSAAVAAALNAGLISPNESDRNLEPANVVDGLFAIARAIDGLADTVTSAFALHVEVGLDRLNDLPDAVDGIAEALDGIANRMGLKTEPAE